jgi:hypothetical protein
MPDFPAPCQYSSFRDAQAFAPELEVFSRQARQGSVADETLKTVLGMRTIV